MAFLRGLTGCEVDSSVGHQVMRRKAFAFSFSLSSFWLPPPRWLLHELSFWQDCPSPPKGIPPLKVCKLKEYDVGRDLCRLIDLVKAYFHLVSSFCRVLPSQSSLTDRKVFCKAMLCFLWSTWVVRKCCFLLQTHRRQSIMDFPQPRYRNAKKRVQIQMLCIYKDCNSTEDKVWSRYRNTNASTNTNTVYLQTLQQQRRQGVLDFP